MHGFGDKQIPARITQRKSFRTSALLCLVSLIYLHPLFAQTPQYVFDQLTTVQGLSSNKVEAILQDKQGFYWIATQNGLNRFDGTNCRIYRHDTRDSTSLTNNYCTALAEDPHGDIWVATHKGVSRYRKKQGVIQQIYLSHPAYNFELANRIYNVAVDADGNIWISGNGLWKYDLTQDKLIFYQHNPANLSTPSRESLFKHMISDPIHKGIWISTGYDLNFFVPDQQKFFHQKYNPLHWKIFDHADGAEITLDHQGRLWFRDKATQSLGYFSVEKNELHLTKKKIQYGIKQIAVDPQDRIWFFYWLARTEIFDPASGHSDTTFLSFHSHRPAVSDKATCLYTDHFGNFWIGSEKGISIFDPGNQYYKTFILPVKDPTVEDQTVQVKAMAQDRPGHLWLGTSLGLFSFQLESGHYQQHKLPVANKSILALCITGDTLWVGTKEMIHRVNPTNGKYISGLPVEAGSYFLRTGTKHDVWIGYWNEGLANYQPHQGQFTHYLPGDDQHAIKSPFLITELVDHNLLWVGYNAGIGYSSYNILSNTWQHFHPQKADLSSSNAGTITVILKDQTQHLWLGTHGAGIFCTTVEGQKFDQYQQQDGLSSNYINSILEDDSGNLWISTADGINYFNTREHTLRSLDIDLTYPNNDFRANGLKGLDGNLYFFHHNEIVEINPDLYPEQEDDFPLAITGFKVFDKEIPYSPGQPYLKLSHRENFFTFSYAMIGTKPNDKVHYTYMLKGFDQRWHEAGHLQSASYTNVPGGHYQFCLKATFGKNRMPETMLEIPIYIKPPYWQTWWFMSLCILGITSLAYRVHRYRLAQVQKIHSVRDQISRDLHDDIGASLSSIHFYTSIAEKEVAVDPDKAKSVLHQINQRSRQLIENISDIVWANQSSKQERSTLAGRIKNFGYDLLAQKNIDCTYKVDPKVENKLTNPEARRNILLIIKEAMNNMAKYSEAGHADIAVAMNGTYVVITVTDDGKGFDMNRQPSGNGIPNMKKRAQTLGGELIIESFPGKGTSLHCRIPLPNISG